MTSTIKVDNIQKTSDASNIIKKCGTTTTVGSGSGQTIVVDGATVTLGRCGGAVNLASGATQSGFGRTGTVNWCTTAKTGPLTAVSGKGYFINTGSGAITVTLPSSPSAGDIVAFKDYGNSWQTSAVTICRNGSKINGGCFNASLNTKAQSVTLIYVDGTKGWQDIHDSTANVSGVPTFIVACGGTVTTSGDFKIHTFNSTSTFTVCTAPTPANNNISYMVVAGGGGASENIGGGGGAGGFREGKTPATPYTASPLVAPAGLPVAASTTYPVTVGGGGVGGAFACAANGSDSIFSSITSTGGGKSGDSTGGGPVATGQAGGSGGGGASGTSGNPGGAGNTPPVSPPQGNAGGNGSGPGAFPQLGSGGGGGATAAGVTGTTSASGNGGAGASSEISGSAVVRAGGGGGRTYTCSSNGSGGTGGGAPGGAPGSSRNGTANTGGGAGGGAGTGGSGVVIIRYKFQ